MARNTPQSLGWQWRIVEGGYPGLRDPYSLMLQHREGTEWRSVAALTPDGVFQQDSVQRVRIPSSQLTSSTTFAAVPGVSFECRAGGLYFMQGMLVVSDQGTANGELRFTGLKQSGVQSNVFYTYISPFTTTLAAISGTPASFGNPGAAAQFVQGASSFARRLCLIMGQIDDISSDSTMTMEFRSLTGGQTVEIGKGSNLVLTRMN